MTVLLYVCILVPIRLGLWSGCHPVLGLSSSGRFWESAMRTHFFLSPVGVRKATTAAAAFHAFSVKTRIISIAPDFRRFTPRDPAHLIRVTLCRSKKSAVSSRARARRCNSSAIERSELGLWASFISFIPRTYTPTARRRCDPRGENQIGAADPEAVARGMTAKANYRKGRQKSPTGRPGSSQKKQTIPLDVTVAGIASSDKMASSLAQETEPGSRVNDSPAAYLSLPHRRLWGLRHGTPFGYSVFSGASLHRSFLIGSVPRSDSARSLRSECASRRGRDYG